MQAEGRGPDPLGLATYRSTRSPQACTEEGPQEDAVGRRLSAGREERCPQKPILPAP